VIRFAFHPQRVSDGGEHSSTTARPEDRDLERMKSIASGVEALTRRAANQHTDRLEIDRSFEVK
jgi:hypothetical protein